MDIETDQEYLSDASETLEAYQHRTLPKLYEETTAPEEH